MLVGDIFKTAPPSIFGSWEIEFFRDLRDPFLLMKKSLINILGHIDESRFFLGVGGYFATRSTKKAKAAMLS